MFVTKRKLANAIKRASEDGKFGRLSPEKATAQLFLGEPIMHWSCGVCGNSKSYAAYIRTRSDGSLYVSWPSKIHSEAPITPLALP